MTEETSQEVQEEQGPNLASLLKNFANAPDETPIENWKQVHGEVLCSGMSETELYIWRPLTRSEFASMQAAAMQAEQQATNLEHEEKVVNQCVLWATEPGQKALQSKAGTLTTLHEQIMQNSNFVDPRMASALVIKL